MVFPLLSRGPQLPHLLIPFGDGGAGITFYAISYLIGAGLALFLSSWRAHEDGYPKDFFINLFFVAFPMGIIGGRVWYVIADWSSFFGPNATQDWYAIWEGGMAIQGGAIFGIGSGMLFAKFRRRGCPLLQACDWAVPTILVAQMIGRWGNFFNAEVHGNIVSSAAYPLLPGFIINQMGYSGLPNSGDFIVLEDLSQMFAPLFLIEGLMNVAGYFLITRGFETVFKRYRLYGDETFSYLVWYGLTRLLLEPVRDSQYHMTMQDGGPMQAVIMAWIFVAIGLALIAVNHLIINLGERGIVHYGDKLSNIMVNHASYYLPEGNHFRQAQTKLVPQGGSHV